MSKERLLRNNLIGKRVRVGDIQGTIIDESKNMLTIQEKNGIKKMIKKNCKFEIDGLIIEGEKIVGRIEDRSRAK